MKILVISSNLIGDTILSTGVIGHFLNLYPKSQFTFVVGPTSSQIYQHFPALENIIIIKKRKFNLHWLEIFLKNRNIKWDIVIDLRSSLLPYLFNSKKKYIFKKNINFHHIEQLSKSFNLNANSLNIYTSPLEEKKVNHIIDKNYKYIVVFPGGNWIPKIWPINNYNKLLIELFEKYQNIKFIIVGSHDERKKYLSKIQENIPKDSFIDLMGESLTLTSAYMKKSDLFIGNDSGLMHLSVASNLKTIALFGPTNDNHYGHKNNNCFVIRTKEKYEYFKQINIDIKKSYMTSIENNQILRLIRENKLL